MEKRNAAAVQPVPPEPATVEAAEPGSPALAARWRELMDLSERLLLAALRREIGPKGDLRAAHREWLRANRDEADRELIAWLERRTSRPRHG